MEYEVRVGREVDGITEETHNHHTEVIVTIVASKDEPAQRKMWAALVVAVLIIIVPATVYGVTTGDFFYLQSITDGINRLAAAMVDAAVSALKK